jgi:hypothetical protein
MSVEPETPITVPLDVVEPFPVEVLPTPLARLVTEGAAALPCPPNFLGVLMLPPLGAAIGTSRVLEVKPEWHEGPRLYAAVVAAPGGKKGPALELVAAPYRRRQRTLRAAYLHDRAWNGAPILVNRKTRQEPIVLDNPFVNVAGCLPPDLLGQLTDAGGREDGFAHRLLFAFPDPPGDALDRSRGQGDDN